MKMMLADCRTKVTVDVIRGKWKPIIIKALKNGSLGYAELRRIVPEPTKKVLTDHLRELCPHRIWSDPYPSARSHARVGKDAQRTCTWSSKGRGGRLEPLHGASSSPK